MTPRKLWVRFRRRHEQRAPNGRYVADIITEIDSPDWISMRMLSEELIALDRAIRRRDPTDVLRLNAEREQLMNQYRRDAKDAVYRELGKWEAELSRSPR